MMTTELSGIRELHTLIGAFHLLEDMLNAAVRTDPMLMSSKLPRQLSQRCLARSQRDTTKNRNTFRRLQTHRRIVVGILGRSVHVLTKAYKLLALSLYRSFNFALGTMNCSKSNQNVSVQPFWQAMRPTPSRDRMVLVRLILCSFPLSGDFVSSREPTESSQSMVNAGFVNSADETHNTSISANAAAVIACKPIRYLHRICVYGDRRKCGGNDNLQTEYDMYTRATVAVLNETTKAMEVVANWVNRHRLARFDRLAAAGV